MRQTGLEAPPLAEMHASTCFLCPLMHRFCHKGIYRNLSECAVVFCQNKDQTKTKSADRGVSLSLVALLLFITIYIPEKSEVFSQKNYAAILFLLFG